MEERKARIPGYHDIDLIGLFCDGRLTRETQNKEPSIFELAQRLEISSARLRRLLLGKFHEQQSDVDKLIKSIIESGVDVDKLSYLRLDAHFCGVPYGSAIDLPAIFSRAMICHRGPSLSPHLAFSDSAVQALENVVMTRFWHFNALYWHHTNRAAMTMLLRTVMRLYMESDAKFHDYLESTLWSGDLAALAYLNATYAQKVGRLSIINGFPEVRKSLYKRLYTFRVNESEEDKVLLDRIKTLNFEGEKNICKSIAQCVAASVGLSRGAVGEDDVLIDIPGRRMDSGGEVYVVLGNGTVETLARVSEPIRHVNDNYLHLAKRARLFVSPRLAAALTDRFGGEFRSARRREVFAEMDAVVSDAVKVSQFM